MFGSTSARRHSMHTGEERAKASSSEHLAGPGVPEGGPQGRALCLPCWPRGNAGGGGIAGPTVAAGSHSPGWAPCRGAEERCPAAAGGPLPAPSFPLSRWQTPSTPLPGDGALRAGILCSHLAPWSRGPSASYWTCCASTVSTWRVPALSAPHQATLTHALSLAAFALLPTPRVTMATPRHHCDITVTKPGRNAPQAPKQDGGSPGQPVPVRPHPQNPQLPPNSRSVSPLSFQYYASPPEELVPQAHLPPRWTACLGNIPDLL